MDDDEDSLNEEVKNNEKPNNNYAFRTKTRRGEETDASVTTKSVPAKLRTLHVWFIKDRFVGFNN